MATGPNEAIQGSLAEITDPQVRLLTTRFVRYLAQEDISTHPLGDLARHAADLIDFARVRPADEALVRTSGDNDSSDSALQVVTDDMPFLVDSVTNALGVAGLALHLVVHPQLVVRRDADGRLLEILDIDVDDARPAGTLAESWMWIEVAHNFRSDNLHGVENSVQDVLKDVRLAVRDWKAMRSRAVIVAEEIASAPPKGITEESVASTVDLLRWLADDNLTFLGYREYALQTIDGEDQIVPVEGTGLGILSAENHSTDEVSRSFATLPAGVRTLAREPKLLILTKANSRSVEEPVSGNVERMGFDGMGLPASAADGGD